MLESASQSTHSNRGELDIVIRAVAHRSHFVDPQDGAPGFRAGLNFVSFQDSPERLTRLLRQPGWLGGTNFGGDPAAQPPGLDRLLAAVFLVPPASDGEQFPWAAPVS